MVQMATARMTAMVLRRRVDGMTRWAGNATKNVKLRDNLEAVQEVHVQLRKSIWCKFGAQGDLGWGAESHEW